VPPFETSRYLNMAEGVRAVRANAEAALMIFQGPNTPSQI